MRYAAGEEVLWADAEGYYDRGIRRQIEFPEDQTADKRALKMLMARLNGEEYESEMVINLPERVPVAKPLEDPGHAKIAFVTTAGLVPWGNPDRIPSAIATHYGKYSIKGMDILKEGEWDSIHGGYDQAYARENPMVIMPLDGLRRMEKEGQIGELYNYIYSTTGNLNNQVNAKAMAHAIVEDWKNERIDAVVFESA